MLAVSEHARLVLGDSLTGPGRQIHGAAPARAVRPGLTASQRPAPSWGASAPTGEPGGSPRAMPGQPSAHPGGGEEGGGGGQDGAGRRHLSGGSPGGSPAKEPTCPPAGILTPARAGAPPLRLASARFSSRPPPHWAAPGRPRRAAHLPQVRRAGPRRPPTALLPARLPACLPPPRTRAARRRPVRPSVPPPAQTVVLGRVSQFAPFFPQIRQKPQPAVTAGAVKRGAGGATGGKVPFPRAWPAGPERRWRRGR